MSLPLLVHGLWQALSLPSDAAFRRALLAPERTQDALLRETLRAQAQTQIGRRLDFASICSRADFRKRVPLTRYEDYASDMDAIRRGDVNVLTAQPVPRLVPSSGSSATAAKLIPYTPALHRQLQRAIAPWIVDVLRRHPSVRAGAAYWSVSPAFQVNDSSSAVPIGFDTDASYLGGLLAPLIDKVLVIPEGLRHAQDISAFQYTSLRLLLACENLRLISIWHPSFLSLLWARRKVEWDRLIDDIRLGRLSPPRPLGARAVEAVSSRLKADPRRADLLAALGPECAMESVWPKLSLVSAWADAAAESPFAELGTLLKRATLAPKGLLATEGCVTIPYAGSFPLAVRSHFFELLDENERICELNHARIGATYEVVITTMGGLYRYRLGDRVRMEGTLGATPSLRFVGRADSRVDLTGEKLCEAFAHAALRKAFGSTAIPTFAMLAPDPYHLSPAYTLYIDAAVPEPAALRERLERALCENPHFAYARALGQLGPVRVYQTSAQASEQYMERLQRDGARLGNIKPSALSRHNDWSAVLSGRYAPMQTH